MQKNTLATSRVHSYALGPLDESSVAWLTVDPLDAPPFRLLTPGPDDLPTSLLIDPVFQDAVICGYTWVDPDEEMKASGVLPVSVATWVWKTVDGELAYDGPFRTWVKGCSLPWIVGYILGGLSLLAETDRELALVGAAHLAYLLRLLPLASLPCHCMIVHDAKFAHAQALRAYRSQVRDFKAQGYCLADACQLALAAGSLLPVDQGQSPLHAWRQALRCGRLTLGAPRPGENEEVA